MSKFKEVIYEDEECVSIWRYNPSKPNSGPVEVEHKWKKNFNPWEKTKKKTLGDLVKEQTPQKTKRSVKN